MKVNELINIAYQTATGKTRKLSQDSQRYERMLLIANAAAKQWEGEPGTIWESLCHSTDIGVVEAGKKTYQLPRTIRTLEIDKDVILEKGDKKWSLPLISYQQLRDGCTGVCFEGWKIEFSGLVDDMEGATIKVPAVLYVPDMTKPDDDVVVDDPYWLVYMMAAEFVRNSRTKQNQYGNLIAMAQASMSGMKDRNYHNFTEIVREDIGL